MSERRWPRLAGTTRCIPAREGGRDPRLEVRLPIRHRLGPPAGAARRRVAHAAPVLRRVRCSASRWRSCSRSCATPGRGRCAWRSPRTSSSSATRRSWCSSSSSTSRCPRSASAWRRRRPRSIGMSLNFAGYATEILRSGIDAVPQAADRGGPLAGLRPPADLPAHHRVSRRCARSTRRSRASSCC